MNQTTTLLSFGFLLGIKHAFDTDHVIAVSTMVSEYKNPLRASLVGAFWGFGHTTTLFMVGILVIVLKINIPENARLFFESIVGLMLVLLGIKVLFQKQTTFHEHTHQHHTSGHTHLHFHQQKEHLHQHHKSFLIGLVHGLAGSGALTILVLSTTQSVIEGLYYILIFGIGSIVGMSMISILIGLPFILSNKKFPPLERYIRLTTGVISIIFGTTIIYENQSWIFNSLWLR